MIQQNEIKNKIERSEIRLDLRGDDGTMKEKRELGIWPGITSLYMRQLIPELTGGRISSAKIDWTV